MPSTQTCLWCRNTLLRHVRRSGVYWFCNSCRQEIHPLLIDLGETQRVKEASHSSSDLVDVQIPLTVRAEGDLPALPIRKLKPDSEPKVVV
ncbi:hypothetical protein [Pseudanabaena sp. FACHB-2040]|uniref:hypothetical protein n=1 Tax=Pseudanabaena sp. FACHB-2040 TaxID=2692859 RepID=UPI0016838798|nr:hypothetical protein [Pseudanabaena sp. FACHB-2040]MBD2260678.1 hypothetical protein [Pseudanabaena sp. FACHB-2040]